MTKPKAKTKKPAAKKPKRNPTDPLALARSVVEAAIGESLTPKKPVMAANKPRKPKLAFITRKGRKATIMREGQSKGTHAKSRRTTHKRQG